MERKQEGEPLRGKHEKPGELRESASKRETSKRPKTKSSSDLERPAGLQTEQSAGLLSRFTISWLDSMMYRNYRRGTLELSDLPAMLDERKATVLVEKFERHWAESWKAYHDNSDSQAPEKTSRKNQIPTVFGIVYTMFAASYLPLGLMKMVYDTSTTSCSLIVKALIQLVTDTQNAKSPEEVPDAWKGYLLGISFLLIMSIGSAFNVYLSQLTASFGVSAKNMLISAIYRKAMRLSGTGRQQYPPGRIQNLVATDCSRIEMAILQFHFTWTFIWQFSLTVGLLIYVIGPSSLVGIGVLLFMVPIQMQLIKVLMVLRKRIAGITDERLKVIQEILGGIRVIKFFAWEDSFLGRVWKLRQNEMKNVINSSFIRALIQSLGFSIPALSSAIVFLVYGATSSVFSPVAIFSALSLINQLRQPVMWIPMMAASVADGKVGFDRLQEFFMAPEVEFEAKVDQHAKNAVTIENGTFEWETAPPESESSKDEPAPEIEAAKVKYTGVPAAENERHSSEVSVSTVRPPALRSIEIEIPHGSLCAIVGPVGSGKSSLLSAMIGEMKRISGDVTFSSSVGYCSQQAWIVNASVRENILFGRPFDKERYSRVVAACALKRDLDILSDGDATEIGERGISLSGGQKQRVSLARLLYSNTDIVLLDDCLSAVDAHVGRWIMEKAICGELSTKTRLFVTHQLHFLPKCDQVIVMKDGEIAEQGTYQGLMQAGGELRRLMTLYGGIDEAGMASSEEEVLDPFSGKAADQLTNYESEHPDSVEPISEGELADALPAERNSEKKPAGIGNFFNLNLREFRTRDQVVREERMRGNISGAVYMTYANSMGTPVFLVGVFILLLGTQATRLANDIWLVEWSRNALPWLQTGQYMGIFAGLGVLQALALLAYSIALAVAGNRAARTIHESVLNRVIRAPVKFFDTNPIGRIAGRFSKDVDYVDNSLADSIRLLLYSVFTMFATFGLVAYFTTGWFLLALVPLLLIYYYVQTIYRANSREIKRLESLTRGPLYAHITESMNGYATIRAYGEQKRFIQKTDDLADINGSPAYLQFVGQRWLQYRLELIGNALVTALALYIAANRNAINSASVGLTLSYLLQVTSLLNMAIFQAAEMEIQIQAVERLAYYLELEVEAPAIIPDKRPPAEWPTEGHVKFDSLEMRYSEDLPLVLKGISVEISPKEKIGIVGRTGSGKSSMMLTLFRIVEASGGRILIDDVDVSTIGLKDLRGKISIIPQDPILFSGTIRSNLDPFEEYNDDQLWKVLERSGLKPSVNAMDGKLDAVCFEGGENLSVGMRQLLCLARAMLKRPKVLLLDECTASVDLETDEMIQKALREDFSESTVLTIAHRLNTVIDYDKVLVLDMGTVKEFDTPKTLLQRPDGFFNSMVDETGPVNSALLRSMAK
ncbi:P-loop containing nucleoside triphosphate hydrolase protein [Cladochytrium replicatum]|nr:P-loop containing nucleoside triphosphate hydrolase protein [Cladochytrium replicatum]